MKILVIHHSDGIGGGTLSAIDLIKSINGYHEVKLVLPLRSQGAKEISSINNITVFERGFKPPIFTFYSGGPSLFYSFFQFIKRICGYKKFKKILRDEEPDLIILNSIVLWPLIKILKKKNIKTLIFIRETMKKNRNNFINKMIISNLNLASGVSFLSSYDKEKWSISNKNQIVIHDGVDPIQASYLTKLDFPMIDIGLHKTDFIVLYTGGDSKIKGPNVVVQTMKLLKKEGFDKIKLLFLGNSELTQENNDLPDNIHFMGIQKDMTKFYTLADLVVFPATKPHQTRLIYEAGAFSKPVIATNYLNYSEFLIENYNGLKFDEGNSNELANKIKYLYENKSELDRMGHNNYLMTLSNHDINDLSDKIKDFILKISEQEYNI